MKTSFVKYQNHKHMLLIAISKAIVALEKEQTIHLVWVDTSNIRGHFHDKKNPFSNIEMIEKFIKSEKIALDKGSITSTSLNKMSNNIKDGDIVIDCFTGALYNHNFTNLSWLIHLPLRPYESEQLSSWYKLKT